MNIRDLSIGDWVMAGGAPHRVFSVNHYGVLVDTSQGLHPYNLEFLSPIPLTPEILEKNGFSHNGRKWYTPELFTLERWGDVWSIVIACSCGEYVCEVCTIKYVHQLQHALRLLKVDKDIIL